MCAGDSEVLDDPRPFAVALERTFADLRGTPPAPERPVLGNGRFPCKKTKYHRGGYVTFEILVPGHSRILFHRLNWEDQSEGCVGIGESFAVLDGRTAIGDSKGGFDEFWSLVKDLDEFDLVVSGR